VLFVDGRQKIRSTGRQNNAAKSPDPRNKRCLNQEFQEFFQLMMHGELFLLAAFPLKRSKTVFREDNSLRPGKRLAKRS
jgi:hypothetical protein